MAAKPNLADSRFGVDGSDVDAVNFTAPTSLGRDTGWTLNQIPSSAVATYLQNKAYRWFQYLSAGILSGAHTFDSTVTVGSTFTVGGMSLTFVDFTFTADSTTDQLTRTAHGLQTGDGPVRVSNSGGGLPAGLVAATDYWLIRVDADHLKVATTLANARLGTAIDITTNGTGTQTLLHQAGTLRIADAEVTRNLAVDGNLTATGTAAVGGSVSIGGDLTIAGSFKHGTLTLSFGALAGLPKDNTIAWSTNGSGFGVQGAGPLLWFIPFSLPLKKRILEVRARLKTSSGAITGTVYRVSNSNGAISLGAGTSVTTGAFETVTVATGLTETVGTGATYQVNFTGGTGTSEYVYIEVDYDQVT